MQNAASARRAAFLAVENKIPKRILLLLAANVAVDLSAQRHFGDLRCVPCHDTSSLFCVAVFQDDTLP